MRMFSKNHGGLQAKWVQIVDEEQDAADIVGEGVQPVRGPTGRGSLHRPVGRQSSAVNLNLLARDAELKRLIEEVCVQLCIYMH